jgi:hypothetical protein
VTACTPVGVAGFPQRGIVVVDGILRAEVVVVIRGGRDLRAKCEVLFLKSKGRRSRERRSEGRGKKEKGKTFMVLRIVVNRLFRIVFTF